MRNAGLSYICRTVALTVGNARSVFTSGYKAGEDIRIPIAHHDGNYTADDETLDRLEGEGCVAFRYAEPVNGSARNIAGIINAGGNVLGMMPHPERMIGPEHGGSDGRRLFRRAAGGGGVSGTALPGGCLCGAVRFTSTAAPITVFHCLCRACQHVSGGAGTVNAVLPADAVAIDGPVAWFESKGDSGAALARGFCTTCGTHPAQPVAHAARQDLRPRRRL